MFSLLILFVAAFVFSKSKFNATKLQQAMSILLKTSREDREFALLITQQDLPSICIRGSLQRFTPEVLSGASGLLSAHPTTASLAQSSHQLLLPLGSTISFSGQNSLTYSYFSVHPCLYPTHDITQSTKASPSIRATQ